MEYIDLSNAHFEIGKDKFRAKESFYSSGNLIEKGEIFDYENISGRNLPKSSRTITMSQGRYEKYLTKYLMVNEVMFNALFEEIVTPTDIQDSFMGDFWLSCPKCGKSITFPLVHSDKVKDHAPTHCEKCGVAFDWDNYFKRGGTL